MPGFYRGAVGDWFGDAIAAMFTEPEPSPVEEPEPLSGRVDVIGDPRHADFAYEAYRLATDLPCGFCTCPGCYGCTPDSEEPCGCGSEENAVWPWPDGNEEESI
jgi:hypothetical protein